MSFLDRPVFGLSSADVLTRIDDITALERHLAAARLEAIGEACAQGVPAQRGYAHPSAFLRDHLKLLPTAAGRMLRLAKALPGLPDVADALTKGAISETQAAVIADAVAALGKDATSSHKAEAVALLLSQAAVLPPKELTLCGNRILHHVAPEAAEARDRKAVEKMERSAWDARAFSVQPDGHGRYRFRGITTAEGAALLQAILDPLTHPNRAAPHAAPADNPAVPPAGESDDVPGPGSVAGPETAPVGNVGPINGRCDNPSCASNLWASRPAARGIGSAPGIGAARVENPPSTDATDGTAGSPFGFADQRRSGSPVSGPGGSPVGGPVGCAATGRVSHPTISGPGNPNAFNETRTATQRRHDALLDACRYLLATETLPENGGSKPQIVITTHYDTLTRQLTAGTLDTGAPLSATEVRRFSCDAGIIPAVLNTHGVPLDLGRERRLINGPLRKALILRDRGCTFPGCDRQPRWCQAHHCQPWSHGGRTCLSNSVLLCGFHHRLIHHDDGWTVHIGTDGHAWFTPPPWLEPQQTPRRNLYHV